MADDTTVQREARRGPGRPRVNEPMYPHRLMVFLDDERQALLEERARVRRETKARIMRDLLDEAAKKWRREKAA